MTVTAEFQVPTAVRLTAEHLAQAAELEYENEILEQKIGQLDSVQGVIDIAKEELGMVDPNVAVIDPAG